MFNLVKAPITPEVYTQKLNEALPKLISSVILYGSAASGDRAKKSDYNLLVVGARWGVLELNQVARVSQEWLKAGNPPPLLFTLERLKSSADCFPIEMLDMKQFYKVLYGADALAEVKVDTKHLRLMVEREIKSLKIQLRQGVMFANANPDKILKLAVNNLSVSFALMRGALRVYGGTIPAKKREIPTVLKTFVPEIDSEAFEQLRRLKDGELKAAEVNPLGLFDRFLGSLIAVGDAIDAHAD